MTYSVADIAMPYNPGIIAVIPCGIFMAVGNEPVGAEPIQLKSATLAKLQIRRWH
jgi:hypothetical protein